MNAIICSIAVLTLLSLPATGWSGSEKVSKNKLIGPAPQVELVKNKSVGHCPPGLAKKAVPCVPPGQVKNRYRVGDRIDRDYSWINDPYRYGLKRGDSYVRAGDYVYRIDPDTRKVLNLIGAVADILN